MALSTHVADIEVKYLEFMVCELEVVGAFAEHNRSFPTAKHSLSH